jgi:hypothetical protein
VADLLPNTTRAKPDWEYWSSLDRVSVGAAVALACDVDPREIDFMNDQNAPDLAQARKRAEIADTCAGKSLRAHRRTHEGLYDPIMTWEVTLPDFAAWALGMSRPWTLPEEFPRTQPKAIERNDNDESNPRRRNNLLRIILAIVKADPSLDLSAPSKAAEAIEALTRKAGRRVSARSIEDYLKQAASLPED